MPSGAGGFVRLRLDLAYDGAGFSGWAVQPGRRTVQETLTGALEVLLRAPVRLVVAGRTDAGVHATGQVAHVDVPTEVWAATDQRFPRRLAGVLPPDVRVHRVAPVTVDFDARFSALWRRYVYRVADDSTGVAPLRRHDTVGWPRPLDDAAVRAAADGLLGLHDFAAFCRRRDGATTVRTLQEFSWVRDEGVLVATVRADAFCHSMVRSLVGCVLSVGEGRRGVGWAEDFLARRERSGAFTVAPAHGLTLAEVGYPPEDQLAARGLVTRALRPALREDAAT